MLSMVRSREGPDGETVVFLESICFSLNRFGNFRTRRRVEENCLPPVPPTARNGLPGRPRYTFTFIHLADAFIQSNFQERALQSA